MTAQAGTVTLFGIPDLNRIAVFTFTYSVYAELLLQQVGQLLRKRYIRFRYGKADIQITFS